MRTTDAVLFSIMLAAAPTFGTDNTWYTGDERCPPPRDDGTYSAPYNALEHRQEYPMFFGADKPGWSCSYQKDNGVIVQYGDSRTPQQQWVAVWGDSHDN
ncbi:MAG: hypothetical protein WC007_12550 [Pelobacteraceae bacterium]